jgi:DNA-binding response OmpR family regulator
MPAAAAHRVLIVEDDTSILGVLAQFLEGEGFPVTTAVDGGAALQVIDGRQPLAARVCVVLLDLRLPGIPGLVVLRYLGDRAPGVPVVVMTAEHSAIPAARAAGAASVLAKPFGLEELLAAVTHHCPHQAA